MKAITLSLACVMLPVTLHAQQACTYDQCALRIEQNRIVAGTEGRRVGTLGFMTSTDLTSTFAISDSAAAHYRVFRDNYAAGTGWSLVSAAALAVLLTDLRESMSFELSIGVAATSIVTGMIGGNKTRRAHNGLSRAIWWYNRSLPK